jgi:hypothetical protein
MMALALTVVLALVQHAHTPGMDARGKTAMGFDQARATHHFVITTAGGEIRITAHDSGDAKTVEEIRAHVRQIEKLFASGDFTKPEYIHGEMPPGAARMAELKGEIAYTYKEAPAGATLVIESAHAEAVAAVHEYFRYQIKEHRTGDPSGTV